MQESLTNARKHAGPARAHVRLRYADDGLTLQIDDDGRGTTVPTEPSDGNGFPGMRERATALGGTLTAGPRPGGGFRVEARLPSPAPPMPSPTSEHGESAAPAR